MALSGEITTLLREDGSVNPTAVARTPTGEVALGRTLAPTLRSTLYRWSRRVYEDFLAFGLPHGAGPLAERPLTLWAIRLWREAHAQVTEGARARE